MKSSVSKNNCLCKISNMRYIKGVRIRSYSVRMRENTDQNNSSNNFSRSNGWLDFLKSTFPLSSLALR